MWRWDLYSRRVEASMIASAWRTHIPNRLGRLFCSTIPTGTFGVLHVSPLTDRLRTDDRNERFVDRPDCTTMLLLPPDLDMDIRAYRPPMLQPVRITNSTISRTKRFCILDFP
jgi:hypothetical protein